MKWYNLYHSLWILPFPTILQTPQEINSEWINLMEKNWIEPFSEGPSFHIMSAPYFSQWFPKENLYLTCSFLKENIKLGAQACSLLFLWTANRATQSFNWDRAGMTIMLFHGREWILLQQYFNINDIININDTTTCLSILPVQSLHVVSHFLIVFVLYPWALEACCFIPIL